MKIYTLTHIADWEGGTTVYTSENAIWRQVWADVQEAAERAGELVPDDPDQWPDFIGENGWKVQRYDVEEHVIEPGPDEPFDYTPPVYPLCAVCGVHVEHEEDVDVDSWRSVADKSYQCGPPLSPSRDHAPDNAAQLLTEQANA